MSTQTATPLEAVIPSAREESRDVSLRITRRSMGSEFRFLSPLGTTRVKLRCLVISLYGLRQPDNVMGYPSNLKDFGPRASAGLPVQWAQLSAVTCRIRLRLVNPAGKCKSLLDLAE